MVPIYFDGDMAAQEVKGILEPAGFIVRAENGRLVASRIPPFLRVVEPSGAVRAPKAKRRA